MLLNLHTLPFRAGNSICNDVIRDLNQQNDLQTRQTNPDQYPHDLGRLRPSLYTAAIAISQFYTPFSASTITKSLRNPQLKQHTDVPARVYQYSTTSSRTTRNVRQGRQRSVLSSIPAPGVPRIKVSVSVKLQRLLLIEARSKGFTSTTVE